MPNRDKTGPFGEGPATGWGRGPCLSSTAGRPRRLFKRYKRGFGRGRMAGMAPESGRQALERRERALEQELERVREAKSQTENE